MDRGLLQEQVAAELGVSVATINNWEMNHTGVATRYIPRVVAFLGYDPRGEASTRGERIRMLREQQGLTQKALAERLGLDGSTVTEWELDRVHRPARKVLRRFEEFLGGG